MAMEIIPFDFETNAIRVVMVEDALTFVATDVCRSVEISKYRDAIARLDGDERVSVLVDTLGGQQTMTAVTESGLYALIMMSRKPAAKRFRKWVTAEVLPALLRDGSYSLPRADDRAELADKRAYYALLPEIHKTRADAKAGALRQIEALMAEGIGVSAAIAEVAEATGIGKRTLYAARRTAWMVARGDWQVAMAPLWRWNGPRGMLAECHPEVLRLFLDLCQTGARVADCYRRTVEVANERGWQPVPCARTMYRVAQRSLPRSTPRATPNKQKKEAA